MPTALTPKQIAELYRRHGVLVAEIKLAVGRLGDIAKTLKTGKAPTGKSLDDIGKPIMERP